MRVTIDREGCIQCHSCSTICPEFFEPDPQDDRSRVLAQYRADGDLGAGNAPDTLYDCVTPAADACPVSVIHLEKTKGEYSYGP